MCNKSVNENKLAESAGKIKKKNFKTRRRTREFNITTPYFRTIFLFLTFINCFNYVLCNENDVLMLQGSLDEKKLDLPSDRRRPANDQEKDILLLGALGRRKGAYHNNYATSQEDDSIMDLLGKSEYFNSSSIFFKLNVSLIMSCRALKFQLPLLYESNIFLNETLLKIYISIIFQALKNEKWPNVLLIFK